MARAITNDACNALCCAIAIDANRGWQICRCVGTHAGHVVIKNERRLVIQVSRTANTLVSRTEITISDVIWYRNFGMLDRSATPVTVLPVCGHNDPLFT